jgi:hypothetical protein
VVEEIEAMLPIIYVVALLDFVVIGIPLAIIGYLGLSTRRITRRQKYEPRGTYRGRGTFSRVR